MSEVTYQEFTVQHESEYVGDHWLKHELLQKKVAGGSGWGWVNVYCFFLQTFLCPSLSGSWAPIRQAAQNSVCRSVARV